MNNVYPEFWQFTPVQGKRPFIDKWQLNPLPFDDVKDSSGIGLMLGESSAGVMAIDFDGKEAETFFEQHIMPIEEMLKDDPIIWSSGKPNRMQVSFVVPQEYWPHLKMKKVSPNKKLELRWNGGQSVLPPSPHPDTGGAYQWMIEPNEQNQLLEIPAPILSFWLEACEDNRPDIQSTLPKEPATDEQIDEVLSFLSKHTTPAYDDWLEIIFATAKECGVSAAITKLKYYFPEQKSGEYEKALRSFDASRSPTFGTLMHMAHQIDKDFRVTPAPPAPAKEETATPVAETAIKPQEALISLPEPSITEVIDTLPQTMRDAIYGYNLASGVPLEMCITSALAVANFATQRHWNVDPIEFSVRPITEYFIGLQKRSGGKTSMYKAYLKAVFEHRDSMRLSYNKERDDYKAEMAMYNKQLKHLTEGDAPPVEPQKPSFFDPFIASPTLNGLLDHLSDCATAGIFSDEGTKFVNSYDNRDVKTGISLAANLCNLWDGSELSKDTGIEKARLFNRRCNLLLLLQKTEAANLVNNDRLKGQGFESRTLVVDSPEWILKKIDDVYEANKKAGEAQQIGFHNRITAILNTSPNTSTYDVNELILGTLKWDEDVHAARKDWYNTYADLRNDLAVPERAQGLISKMYEHTCRLAGTLCAYESRSSISAQNWAGAMKLITFYVWQRITMEDVMDLETVDKTVLARDKLVGWLKEENHKDFDKQFLGNSSPRPFRDLPPDVRNKILTGMIDDEILIKDGRRMNLKK